jgi:hypothetical protein
VKRRLPVHPKPHEQPISFYSVGDCQLSLGWGL